VHVADPLRDPDDGKLVGYVGIYTATALVQRAGDPAKALLIDPARETLRGDRLLSADAGETPVTFALRSPASEVHGRIIDVVGGPTSSGRTKWSSSTAASATGSRPATCSPSTRRAMWCATCSAAAADR